MPEGAQIPEMAIRACWIGACLRFDGCIADARERI
jgi:hypothetical protein